jgi:hypothetical protein
VLLQDRRLADNMPMTLILVNVGSPQCGEQASDMLYDRLAEILRGGARADSGSAGRVVRTLNAYGEATSTRLPGNPHCAANDQLNAEVAAGGAERRKIAASSAGLSIMISCSDAMSCNDQSPVLASAAK